MTPDELYEELRKRGHYVLFFTTVAEVKQVIHDATDDEIRQGLEWLYYSYADGHDFDSAVELLQDRIISNRERAACTGTIASQERFLRHHELLHRLYARYFRR